MWAPRFGQCLTLLTHLLLLVIILFVVITDISTIDLILAFQCEASKAQNTFIQPHLPNSHPSSPTALYKCLEGWLVMCGGLDKNGPHRLIYLNA